ncbi:MAG: metallophosphoesterase family protein [Acidobacteriota bacterium]|jgi:predicted phosphodiesterase|nr:metallophosphoesterase family protein [Acidobacteriota bacterium]
MIGEPYDVVILSDLHLGSEISRAREALELLQSLRFHRLILLGDIFCDLNFRRLKREHWDFLSHIRKLSNPKRKVDVVWVEGNHDYGLVDVMSHLVGVPAHREYTWESGGVRHLAIHGHQFDNFIIRNHLLLNGLASQVYLSIQKLSSRGRVVARMLDRLDTRWQRLTPKVAAGAMAYARARGADCVYCGHTHEAVVRREGDVFYANAGAWTHRVPSYITIREREVKIHEYVERTDRGHSGPERGEIAAALVPVAAPAGLPAHPGYENISG